MLSRFSFDIGGGEFSPSPGAVTAHGGLSVCSGVCSAWATLCAFPGASSPWGLSTAVHTAVHTFPQGLPTVPAGDAL